MVKTADQRESHNRTGKILKKIRRRYIRKVAGDIAADHSLLWVVAKKMKARGIYAETTMDRDIRFYILRGMSALDGSRIGSNDWHYWLLKNGWGQRWHAAA